MYRHFGKRALDLVLAVLALPFWLLLLAIVAPFIYLEDKGTVFYNVSRLGKNGTIYKMYKFRTMKMNAPDIRNEDYSTFNAKNDQRLTKVGKFLRSFSIDETPQILNILKNEMSLIGPRPDLPEHINFYQEKDKSKLSVLPGITGFNQAYYRNCVEWKERLDHDVYYVEHLSFWFDVKIFFKTIERIIVRKGVYMTHPNAANGIDCSLYEIKPLSWDTDYFNIPSARVNLNNIISKEEQKNIIKICRAYKFITIYNQENRKENNQWIGEDTTAFLTDVNLQFRMIIKRKSEIREGCELVNNYPENQNLLELGKHAFIFSRFHNDPNLPTELANNIYYHWIKNSFQKEDKYFVISKQQEEITGFILFSLNSVENTATIELIAVDPRFRGKKIGDSLIKTMKSYVFDNGIRTIMVGTQADNLAAVQFYMKEGFQYVSCNSVYHLWN